jgi:hypothetical protein
MRRIPAFLSQRIGWIGKAFFKRKIDDGLSHFQAYLRKEGKNLILEA